MRKMVTRAAKTKAKPSTSKLTKASASNPQEGENRTAPVSNGVSPIPDSKNKVDKNSVHQASEGEPMQVDEAAGPSKKIQIATSSSESRKKKVASRTTKSKVKASASNPQEEEKSEAEPVSNRLDSIPESESEIEMNSGSQASEGDPMEVDEAAGPSKQVETRNSRSGKRRAEPKGTVKATSSKSATMKTSGRAKKPKVLLDVPQLKTTSGKVFVLGKNDVGQLGFGEEVESKSRPVLLDLPYSIVDVVAGGMHSVCLTAGGEVITFGCNDEGALGRVTSDAHPEHSPMKVQISERIVQISAGDSHSAALAESGQVYIWGNFRSGDGPLGLTIEGIKKIDPIKILTDIRVVMIASGNEHLVCLSKDGIVYTCGAGETGQLGRISARSCEKGGRKGLGNLLEPRTVPVGSVSRPMLVDRVWAGAYTTFLRAQGTGEIYACGLNNYNHLGYENEDNVYTPKQVASFDGRTWLQISGGQHHTLALDSTGEVYSLGRKEYGRLGLGENCEDKSSPTVIPTFNGEPCVDISAGEVVSLSVSEKGSVYSWGMGTSYQLGHGNDDDCHTPQVIRGKQFDSWKAVKVSGGGQHSMILACQKGKSGEKS